MAAIVDPYSECPCGSGDKYKWCCHKVEATADHVQRCMESGQVDTALKTLDEALRTHPEGAWLWMQKAIIHSQRDEFEPAKAALRSLIAKRPNHLGAYELLVRLVLLTEGPRVAAGVLQQALTSVKTDLRKELAAAAGSVGSALAESGLFPAAFQHFVLSERLDPLNESRPESGLQSLRSRAEISPWLRHTYRLSPVPEGLDAARQARFRQALAWAEEGLWAPAAAAFDRLASESTPESDRNLGLCRLWLGDHAGAVQALRRYTNWVGENPETVDLEALCQLIEPVRGADRVELLQWIWTLRQRAAFLSALRASDRVFEAGKQPIDANDETSIEVDHFLLLDRPKLADHAPLDPEKMPRVLGRVLVGQEIVVLEAYDDGRLDRLAEWVKDLAGASIPPAHPRTKVMGSVPRHVLAMRSEWLPPKESDPEALMRLRAAENARIIDQEWPSTALPALGGRTPLQAANDPRLRLALRAAVLLVESQYVGTTDGPDLNALRQRLCLEPEPEPNLEMEALDSVHVGRLEFIRPERLDDSRLPAVFERALKYNARSLIERTCHVLLERPHLWNAEKGVTSVQLFATLSALALSKRDSAQALKWIEQGRESDPNRLRPYNSAFWDLEEIRVRALSEEPEAWVPLLAGVVDRAESEPDARRLLLVTLTHMGLIQPVPNPDRPDEVLLDARPLHALLSRYGPRIVTASGELGVTAAKRTVITPGEVTQTPGGILLPGAPLPPTGQKPNLIITGR